MGIETGGRRMHVRLLYPLVAVVENPPVCKGQERFKLGETCGSEVYSEMPGLYALLC